MDKGLDFSYIDQIPAGICVFEVIADGSGPGGRAAIVCVAANPFYCDMAGVELDTVVGTRLSEFKDIVHPDDRERSSRELEEKLLHKGCSGSVFRIRNGCSGEYIWVNMIIRLFSRDGRTFAYAVCNDVTAHKKVENDLNNSQLRYQMAVRGADLNIWEYDPIKKTETSSREFSDNYKVEKGSHIIENVPESLCEHIIPEDKEKFMAMYRKIDEGAKYASEEVWHDFAPDGKLHCEHIFYTVVHDDDGRPIRAYGLGMDTTEQKLEERRFNDFIDSMRTRIPNSLGSFHLNLTKNICDEPDTELEGVRRLGAGGTADDFFYNVAGGISVHEDRERFLSICGRRNLIDAFSHGQDQVSVEYRFQMENGEEHWIVCYIKMVQNPKTGDIEAIADGQDIQEDKLDESVISRVTTTLMDYLAVIDVRSRTIEYREITDRDTYKEGHSRISYDEENRRTIELLLTEDQAYAIRVNSLDYIIEMLDTMDIYTFSFAQKTADGRLLRKQLSYSWLDDDKNMIIMMKTDITESYRHEMEQMDRLKAALGAAREANESKSLFLSNVSHDMRTPLNGMLGYTRLALDQTAEPRTKDYLEKIHESGVILRQLINDTLNLSRIESGKYELKMAPVHMDRLVQRIVDALAPSVDESRLDFVVENGENKNQLVIADESRVQEIFINLLSNAAKFTEPGGRVTFSVERLKKADTRISYRFRVADTGCGISEEFKPQLFEPFAQERLNAGRYIEGTGLGLTIVKRLVEMMDGTIEVESRLGCGSTFTVCLSFEDAGEQNPSDSAPTHSKSLLRGTRILICEDHPMNMEIEKTVLENVGAQVSCAFNGKDGLDQFLSSDEGFFDAIVMDIRMPIMDGLTCARRIRESHRRDSLAVPIIAMSANAYDEDYEKSREAGMNAHLSKPVEVAEFYETLMELINRG